MTTVHQTAFGFDGKRARPQRPARHMRHVLIAREERTSNRLADDLRDLRNIAVRTACGLRLTKAVAA